MEAFLIRRAVPEDVDALIDINIRVWRVTYRGSIADEVLDAMTADSLRDKWVTTVANTRSQDRFCFVATSAGSVVGYAVCGKNRDDRSAFQWLMYAIYILPEYQRKGIGKNLFFAAIEEMRKLKVASFMLYVLKGNYSARHFYEALHPGWQDEQSIEIEGNQYTAMAYGWPQLPL